MKKLTLVTRIALVGMALAVAVLLTGCPSR